jgi:hypothetical protein
MSPARYSWEFACHDAADPNVLSELPEGIVPVWQERKAKIAKDAERPRKGLADQTTLNPKAIAAKLNGQLNHDDCDTIEEEYSVVS